MPGVSGKSLVGDLFGGLAAMMVAFPSAVAFGIIVLAPLGPGLAGAGALAGMVGAIAVGLVAAVFGGTPRLVSAPSAPAAAVLAAFVAQQAGAGPESAVMLMALASIMAGAAQLLFGILGGGRLMKYIPYPVVSGYMSGVGLLIIISQLPKFLGLQPDLSLWSGLLSPRSWSFPAMAVGTVTVAGMILSSRSIRRVPAPILAMAAGIVAYLGLSLVYPALRSLEGNHLVVGSVPSFDLGTVTTGLASRLEALRRLDTAGLASALAAVGTISVLLSIDTLQSSVIVDVLTRSRHNSNRELIGQGLANMAAAALGGIPGSGTTGATLVNIRSGGRTRASGALAGAFAAVVLLLLGRLVSWLPLSALAGILLVIALSMIDHKSLALLKQRDTAFDFAVMAAVAVTAVCANLIAAAGVGVGLAIILFIRDQARASVVRRHSLGSWLSSKRRRVPAESSVLERRGGEIAVYELQGSLFFGTTDKLFSLIEPDLGRRRYIILDLKRVQSVDFTAVRMLEMLGELIIEKGGCLAFSAIPRSLPTGQDLRRYFGKLGLVRPEQGVKTFPELDAALEWAEDMIIEAELQSQGREERLMDLVEIELFSKFTPQGLRLMRKCVTERTLESGEKVFSRGDQGDELFIIRKGEVRIELPIPGRETHHLATFGQGDFFGDIAFMDRGSRTADAVAKSQAHIYTLSRSVFDRFAKKEPSLAGMIFSGLARILAVRLRRTDAELRSLEKA